MNGREVGQISVLSGLSATFNILYFLSSQKSNSRTLIRMRNRGTPTPRPMAKSLVLEVAG
jgi:hypothetical protein